MRARTAVRDMGTSKEAVGLPTSGESGTQVVNQEAWDEMAGEDAVRPPTPGPKTPDTGKLGVIRCPQNLQVCRESVEARLISFL